MSDVLRQRVLDALAKERGGVDWKQYTDNCHHKKAQEIIERGVELALSSAQAEVLKEIDKIIEEVAGYDTHLDYVLENLRKRLLVLGEAKKK